MRRARPFVAIVVTALLAAVTTGDARATTYSPQVTNGEDVEEGDWPFMVGLLTAGVSDRYLAQFCGGSLIDAEWVLTAAHCVVFDDGRLGPSELDVLVGSIDLTRTDGARVAVEEIVAHPGYDPSTERNDIALLRLAAPQTRRTLRHAGPGDTDLEGAGVLATLLGWGGLTPDALDEDNPVTQEFAVVLQQATFPVVGNSECAAEISGFDAAGMLCAGDPDPLGLDGVDACYGDSGGPLFVRAPDGGDVQIGIVSFGPGCAFHPTAYTRVSAYRTWIAEHVTEDDVDAGPLPEGVSRVSGANRYATAAELALERWTAPIDTVFLVTGESFPDALAVAPLASSVGAPVLLTRSGLLPDETRAALAQLQPGQVVVSGGTAAVSDSVEQEVRAVTGAAVSRVAGADRYATAALLSARVAPGGLPAASDGVFLSSGSSFADALGGAAAASASPAVPLLLTTPTSLPAVTAAELGRLDPQTVYVLGGPAAVSSSVVDAVAALGMVVVRLAGATRFETASLVATSIFDTGSSEVVVATGAGFPDGLVAGALGIPLLLVPAPDEVPPAVADAIAALGADVITIMGGTGAVSNGQAHELGATRQ